MNYLRKKIALLMGALIIGQALTMQNMHGMMDAFGNDNTQENANVTWNFWSNAISGLYNSVTNTVSPWYRNARPIKTTTELATHPAILTITGSGIGAYTLYSIFPWWISYPIFTAGGIFVGTKVPVLSHILSEIGDGAHINTALTMGATIINPKTIITAAYESGKAAIGTAKDDAINAIKHEIENDIRYGLNIPANEDVNFDTVTDKVTNKVRNELEHSYRRALNIPANQPVNFDTITDKLTDKAKDEIEYSCRRVLNIPANQPVNIETITSKIVEEPARRIFNIDAQEDVTADAIMSNVAWNTVYRFGIPTAALVAATPIAITAGYFGCKYAYHRLTTEPEPPIFIESSEKSRWQNLKDLVSQNKDEIPELAYSEELEKTFDLITRSSINAFHEIQDGKKNIFYEPVLMYGPPGTGKTAKAKQMIKQIYQTTDGQMQWRITNGSMLLNAGQNGINKMFDWLKKQPAACLFIDEADTLFPDRDEMEKYPERLEIVNHLLSLIGERSNKFMIIMTTNRLGAFDDAMARRIDNLIHIPLPNEQGRNRVLTLYRDNMLLNQQSSWIMQLAEKYCPQLFETEKVNVQ